MEEEDGEAVGVRGVTQVGDIAVGALATDDGGAGRGGWDLGIWPTLRLLRSFR